MDAEQLRLLAAKLRKRLPGDVALSHGKSLDLIAALAGLRNWPEVLAFPDRVAARDYDLDAMARLARRLAGQLGPRLTKGLARLLDPDSLMDMLTPWELTDPGDPARREKLIVASGDSASGSLRVARIADRVERISDRLVWGPVPLEADDPVTFRAARFAVSDAHPDTSDQPLAWERMDEGPRSYFLRDWASNLSVFVDYERIELWVDPDANGQLQLLYLIDWFGRQPAQIDKLFVAQVEERVGGMRPYEHRVRPPRIDPVNRRQVELATLAWDAFRQRDPRAWQALLAQDLDAIPNLRRTVQTMLAELPAAATGLRASQRRLLELCAEDCATPHQVMLRITQQRRPGVFDYWEMGRLLNDLGREPCAAICGIDDGPFDMPLHDDAERHHAYMASPLSLSAFGSALLRGKDDLFRLDPSSFWWGGTLVTRTETWRWDAAQEGLTRN